MKRYLDWFLKSLVVAVVVHTLFRRAPAETTASTGPGALAGPTPGPTPGAALFVGPRGDLPGSANGILAPTRSILKSIAERFKEHNTVLIGASLSYYALFALFPTLIATVSIFGLVADPEVLEQQVQDLTEAVPGSTGQFVADQLTNLTQVSSSGLGIASVVAIITALWSASAGTKALISGINIAYGARDDRGYLVKRAVALLVTLGVIILGVALASAIAFLPQILGLFGFEEGTVALINVVRWPTILFIVLLGLGALYKFAPNRPWRKTPLISIGAGIAATAWLIATIGLSIYVDNFSALPETYGTLTGVVVTMLWFFVSAIVILAGAELNSELEQRHAYTTRTQQS